MIPTFGNERMMREYARMFGYRVKDTTQSSSHDATIDMSDLPIRWREVRVVTPAKM